MTSLRHNHVSSMYSARWPGSPPKIVLPDKLIRTTYPVLPGIVLSQILLTRVLEETIVPNHAGAMSRQPSQLQRGKWSRLWAQLSWDLRLDRRSAKNLVRHDIGGHPSSQSGPRSPRCQRSAAFLLRPWIISTHHDLHVGPA